MKPLLIRIRFLAAAALVRLAAAVVPAAALTVRSDLISRAQALAARKLVA